ncbi:MAG: histone H1 [bacterium]|nr:histone H1 [bacterium]
MARKHPRRPTDINERAKMIVDLATGQITEDDIDQMPPMGREISGQARNAALSAEQRSEIARQGALAMHAKKAAT